MFEALVREIADRFGLGDKANGLLSALLGVIFDQRNGGLAGLLAKFRQQGHGDLFNSWLGSAEPAAMPAQQLENVLGSDTISGIAERLGIARGTVVAAAATMLPKLIGMLTPNGQLPSAIPDGVTSYLGNLGPIGAKAGGVARTPEAAAQGAASAGQGWIKWLVLALVVLTLGWCMLNRTPQVDEPATIGSNAPPVPAPTAAAPVTPTPTREAELSLANEAGALSYSGTVGVYADKTRLTDLLDGTFGPDHVSGDVNIDTSTRRATWLAALGELLPVVVKTPGANLDFRGNVITLGGTLSDTERSTLASTLKELFAGYTLNGLEPPGATAGAGEVLKSLLPGQYSAADLVKALNLMSVEFDSGSASIDSASVAVLDDAAEALKNAPAGTRVEIGGYTDDTGNAEANRGLSDARANAVRNKLIELRVPAEMLTAKGYGDGRPIAGNTTEEGRAKNRRMEFTVVE